MTDYLARAFWISLLLAVPVAARAPHPQARWVATGWLLLAGLLFSIGNWTVLVAQLRKKGSPSFVPPVGPILLVIGLVLCPAPAARPFVAVALVLDPLPVLTLISLVQRIIARRRRRTKSDTID